MNNQLRSNKDNNDNDDGAAAADVDDDDAVSKDFKWPWNFDQYSLLDEWSTQYVVSDAVHNGACCAHIMDISFLLIIT